MLSIELAVASATHSSVDITARLGIEPSFQRAKGTPTRPNPARLTTEHEWAIELARSDSNWVAIERFESVILGWGRSLAAKLGDLRDEGATVILHLNQELDADDDSTRGLAFGWQTVQWLGLATADISLDQYVD